MREKEAINPAIPTLIMKAFLAILGLLVFGVSALTRLVTPHGMDEFKGIIDKINEEEKVALFAFTATWCGYVICF